MTPTIAAGDALPARTLTVTRDDVRRYADASGDHNPIHLDDDAARALGLPGVVAHGMLTSALAIGEVAAWVGGADRVREDHRGGVVGFLPDRRGGPVTAGVRALHGEPVRAHLDGAATSRNEG